MQITASQVIIHGPGLTSAKARKILDQHFIQQARTYLPPRIRGLAQHLGVAHKLKHIKFNKTRTKWGHCTTRGIIQMNWLIMLAPYAVIDYLIAHEVCHLLHMNHSRSFWQLVDSLCPNPKRYVRWLNDHQHRIWY